MVDNGKMRLVQLKISNGKEMKQTNFVVFFFNSSKLILFIETQLPSFHFILLSNQSMVASDNNVSAVQLRMLSNS
jgi:hypothetical protein